MKVFISWSGDTSKNLADTLRQWLPAVIQAVKPYFSPDDITKGARWGTEISKELEESSVGLICLTRDNLEAPWIMFEAGALSKRLDKSKVCPILFGVNSTDLKGPLVQFQATKFEKEDIKKVVSMMNAELGDLGLKADIFDEVFEMWWPKLQEKVDKILKSVPQTDKGALRTERDLLEEVLRLTRTLAAERRSQTGGSNRLVVRDIITLFRMMLAYAKETADSNLAGILYKFERPIAYLIRNVPGESKSMIEVFRSLMSDLENSFPHDESDIPTEDEINLAD